MPSGSVASQSPKPMSNERSLDLGVVVFADKHGDVIAHGSFEQLNVLGNDCHPLAQ